MADKFMQSSAVSALFRNADKAKQEIGVKRIMVLGKQSKPIAVLMNVDDFQAIKTTLRLYHEQFGPLQ